MNPFFRNFNIFLATKVHFSKKTFDKLENFARNYSKNFSFSIFMESLYKSREISDEFSSLILKFIKNLNKIGLDPREQLERG